MLERLCLLAAAASAIAPSASSSSVPPPHDIYAGTFTSAPREDDLLHAIRRCDSNVACAGISLGPNGTVDSHVVHEHTFVGPYRTPRTHETDKPYTYHRGRITGGEIISVEVGLTLRDAKDHCTSDPGCVAFTYPVHSLTGLNYLPNVTFVSTLTDFVPSPDDEYRTYVTNDPTRTHHVNGNSLPYDEDVSDRPYRTCCNRNDVPTIEEIAAADVTLERISCNISREEFFLRYEVPRKPVMLVGCEQDWAARTEWTYEKLAPRFGNSSRWRARFKPDSEDYKRIEWGDIAQAMADDRPFYVFDQLKDTEAKSIEDDFDDPVPMRGGNLYAEMNRRGIYWAGPLRWFCMGRFGSGTRSHVDPFSSDAWNTLIRGHKWWVLYPPGVGAKETYCESSCTDKNLVGPWYASVAVNAARTEFPGDQYPYHVLQRPGETIYAPDGIVHSVFNMDSTIAITRNFGSAANLDAVWEEACTSGDDRKWKIMYNLVLNREQRRRVRQSKYWPFSEYCREASGPSGGTRTAGKSRLPRDEVEDVLHDGGWNPREGDVVEARYRGSHNKWYKGTVVRATSGDGDGNEDGGTYDVAYDDGDTDVGLPRRAVRRYYLPTEGETVKAKMTTEKGTAVWKLAVVTNVRDDNTVDVMHHDRETFHALPLFHVGRFDWRYKKGNRVLARWTDGRPYKGRVTKARGDGTYDVEFDDEDFMTKVGKDSIRFLWAKVK